MDPPRVFICLVLAIVIGSSLAEDQCIPGHPTFRGKMTITQNGYEEMLIGIHADVPEDFSLIEEIKNLVIEGSAALFTATRRRAFIKEAIILLPKTWGRHPEAVPDVGDYTYSRSDMQVGPRTREWDWKPFLRQTKGCEESADDPIYYTSDYIRNKDCANQVFGNRGKHFAVLFGKYRWGVHDESPTDDSSHYRRMDTQARYIPNKCAQGITGRGFHVETGNVCSDEDKRNNKCRFVPDGDESTSKAKASLLYSIKPTSIRLFCENHTVTDPDERHDAESHNEHNRLCTGRSAMDVIRCSPDFQNRQNPPRPPSENTNTRTNFKIIKREATKRVSMVMDVSGSMNTAQRLLKMRRAATHYVRKVIPDQYSLSLVEFDRQSDITADMTLIDSAATRDALVALLPLTARSGTCIGCGILKGIETFDAGSHETAGQRLLILTDGQENASPRISDVYAATLSKEITVDVIIYSVPGAHPLIDLARDTGGMSCFCPDGIDNDACLDRCFSQTIEAREDNVTEKYVGVANDAARVNRNGFVNGSVVVDDSLGRSTEFNFNLDDLDGIGINIFTPSGTTIGPGHPWYDRDDVLRTIKVSPDGISEPGVWKYQVTNRGSSNRNVNVLVRSKPGSASDDPILINGYFSSNTIAYSIENLSTKMYVSVRKGMMPVVGVNVLALVKAPGRSTPIRVHLRDNGAGADKVKDDGVYSAYFFDFRASGRYGVDIRVDTEGAEPKALSVRRSIESCGQRKERDLTHLMESATTEHQTLMPFTRAQPIDFFEATGVPNGNIPSLWVSPARIMDLRVKEVSPGYRRVTLTWTAVGADLDVGTATKYDIRFSEVVSDIRTRVDNCTEITSSEVVSGSLTSPKISGSTEEMTIQVPSSHQGDVIVFTVRAVDEYDKLGDPSNIVMGIFEDSGSSVGLIIGLTLCAVFLITTVVITIALVKKRKEAETMPYVQEEGTPKGQNATPPKPKTKGGPNNSKQKKQDIKAIA